MLTGSIDEALERPVPQGLRDSGLAFCPSPLISREGETSMKRATIYVRVSANNGYQDPAMQLRELRK